MTHTATYSPAEGLTVTHFVHVEPADGNRRDFARWCLDQDPKIMTASSSGSDVPVDLYPSIPVALLEGAYVDGYLYRGADPVPAVRPDGGKPPEPVSRPSSDGDTQSATAAPKAPQKRAQRRSKTRQEGSDK